MISTFFKFIKDHWAIILTVIVLFLLRLPSLFEPPWYVDEGIYAAIGAGLVEGKELYTELWDHKPPGIYLLYALIHLVLPANLVVFGAKFLNLLAGISAIFIFRYFLVNIFMINSQKYIFPPLLLLSILIGLPILEGQNANAENFFLVFIALAIIGLIKLIENSLQGNNIDIKLTILTGISIALASFIKFQPLLEIGIVLFGVFVLAVVRHRSKRSSRIALISIILAGFAWLPHLISGIYFLISGSFNEYLFSVWIYNFGYSAMELTETGALALPMPLKLLIFLLLIISSIYWVSIKKRSWFRFILLIWLVAAFISVFLPNRFYAHYILQLILPLLVNLVSFFYDFDQKKWLVVSKKIAAWGIYFLITIILLVVFIGGSIFLPASNSFKNQANDYYRYGYLQIFSKEFEEQWIEVFAPDSIANKYAIELINKYPSESVFIWGASPWAFSYTEATNASRYLVDFHIYTEAIPLTQKDLDKNQPQYILVDKSRFPLRKGTLQERLNDQYIKIDDNEVYFIYQDITTLN